MYQPYLDDFVLQKDYRAEYPGSGRLAQSVAPVTEMENAIGVNWEINDPDYWQKSPDKDDMG